MYQGGGPKGPSFIENFRNSNDYNTFLTALISDKGGNPMQYRNLMDSIAYHETMGKMDPRMKQIGGGPGRGKYQFEIGNNAGASTAAKRTYQYYKAKGLPIPSWLEKISTSKNLDASTLSPFQQDILFLGNMRMHPKADLSEVISGNRSVEDFWADYHWAGPKHQRNERLNSFRTSMERFSKADGGPKQNTTMDNNLLTYLETGGTHSENPLGGIPIGKGNLAEEGETMTKDYVFSDRIKLTEPILKKHRLSKRLKGKTIAEASKVINKMLKETNDPIDRESTSEMLERLKGANEELRPKTDLPSTTEHAMDPNMQLPPKQMEEGGFLGKETFGDDFGSLMGMAGAGLNLGMQAFGPTGIDTSGQVAYTGGANKGMGIAGGALQGAAAGAALGPLGAAVGGLVGAGAGLIGGNKRQKEMEEANLNYSLAQNSKYRNMKYGGKKYQGGGKKSGYEMLEELMPQSYTPQMTSTQSTTPQDLTPSLNKVDVPRVYPDPILFGGTEDITGSLPTAPLNRPSEQNVRKAERIVNRQEGKGFDWQDAANNALRFAPVATNLFQYMNMRKPNYERLDRIDKKFRPDYVDNQSLVNQVKEQEGTTRRALSEASGGDAGALRSNLLMSHLNSIKGRTSAFMQADNINRQQNTIGQEFDRNNILANMQQGNLENDINARNRAAYDNNRSRFLSQIGQDLGNIGLENIRKKYPERMGLDYNWLGEFLMEQKKKNGNK